MAIIMKNMADRMSRIKHGSKEGRNEDSPQLDGGCFTKPCFPGSSQHIDEEMDVKSQQLNKLFKEFTGDQSRPKLDQQLCKGRLQSQEKKKSQVTTNKEVACKFSTLYGSSPTVISGSLPQIFQIVFNFLIHRTCPTPNIIK